MKTLYSRFREVECNYRYKECPIFILLVLVPFNLSGHDFVTSVTILFLLSQNTKLHNFRKIITIFNSGLYMNIMKIQSLQKLIGLIRRMASNLIRSVTCKLFSYQ